MSLDIKKTFVTIFVSMVAYFLFGTALYAFSIKIDTEYYDNTIPRVGAFAIVQDPEIYYTVKNKAPIPVPLYNAFYSIRVRIEGGFENTRAYYKRGNFIHYFPDEQYDIGVLNSGDEVNSTFMFEGVDEEGIIHFSIEAYMNILNIFNIKVSEKDFTLNVEPFQVIIIDFYEIP